jgi:exosortase/archaeosortase family protein
MKKFEKGSPLRFVVIFLLLFAAFYYFNIFFFGITSRGNYYSNFLAEHLNYIQWLRQFLLSSSAKIINWLGFDAIYNETQLLVAGRGVLELIYGCLGLGLMSFLTAFVIAYPKNLKSKLLFLTPGLICIQLLNILRFVLLGLFWNKRPGMILDHHTIFNIAIYIIIAVSIYFWIRHDHKDLNRAEN